MSGAKTELLALCDAYDLVDLFGAHVEAEAPWLTLIRPAEVSNPAKIRFALGWLPKPERLTDYPNLELICTIGAGADGLLRLPTLGPKVKVCRLRDEEQAKMMAGFAAWQVVWYQRGMAGYLRQQQEQRWNAFNKEPAERFSVGLLGYGHMGQAIATTLTSMGYRLSAAVRNAKQEAPAGLTLEAGAEGLARVAAKSDLLINVLPLTEATRGLLNADFFAMMKPGAILVNLGRGAHVVEADLVAALDSGQVGGASLDVFAEEPLPTDSPLWSHPKILVTPHVASEAADAHVLRFAAEEIQRYEKGEPLRGLIDRSQGY
ncbi:MAG: glyoxylate/hydroxypyruvate reductase A [Pseudomonadota bacterium]